MSEPIDLLKLHLLRAGKERSRALPEYQYRNPENFIEFQPHQQEERECMDIALDKIDLVLQDWADWMQHDRGPAGYPSKAAGIAAPSWIKDSEELHEVNDELRAEATNAAIDSLREVSRRAIYIRFGIGYMVWRYADHGSLYDRAKSEIAPELRKRSVI